MEHDAEKSFIHVESSEGSNPNGSNPVTKVRMLLFRRMLVGVSDGRFFLGSFHCMDKQGNIILQDTVEYRSTRRSSPSPMEQRCLGLILIPFSCRTSCHVDCSIEEQLSLLSLPGQQWFQRSYFYLKQSHQLDQEPNFYHPRAALWFWNFCTF